MLLDAARELLGQGHAMHVSLVGDGPARQALRTHAERLDITDHVTLAGYAANPRPCYSALDAFVLLSRSEGLPNVLFKAMAMEVPAICTPVAGVPAVIEPEHNGLLVPLHDIQATVPAVRRLIDDRALASRLGQAGREHVGRHHSFDRRTERLCETYRRLMGPEIARPSR